jgi:hypothetical protein
MLQSASGIFDGLVRTVTNVRFAVLAVPCLERLWLIVCLDKRSRIQRDRARVC